MLTPSILSAEEIKKYNPRPKSSIVKLSSNENPYGPSERVLNAIKNSFSDACRYPYEFIHELQKTLASKHGVPVESIVITGGSNEALRVTGLAISNQGGNIVAGKPTYLALMSYAEGWGSKIKWVPVDSEKGYDLNKIKSSVDGETKMIFIANPNNPTGTLLNKQSLKDFCEEMSQKTIVFCDEAYYDYINEDNYPSMDYLIRKGEDVIISRTFSKVYGLAGLRIGYGFAHQTLIENLMKVKEPFTPSLLAINGAIAALDDNEFLHSSIKSNDKGASFIQSELNRLQIKTVPSSANFITTIWPSKKIALSITEQLLNKGIIVRYLGPFGWPKYVRFSIGTNKENLTLINGINQIMIK